ncbi:LysR family transcriptional regulator [Streptomyces sp. NPDC091204]|uniref:LysR family transcriptional regulator n=1 Tax=Streptomyces sp. NPDC091204 TaxID=3155299 RepID=UPI003443BA0D
METSCVRPDTSDFELTLGSVDPGDGYRGQLSLRYFLLPAQELNFTRAAARIGIAQPALGARMRRSEAELGTALLAALDRAWDTARSAAAGELGTLSIGYSLSAGAETAPALVDRLIRGPSGLDVGTVPMATPQQPGRGVRRFLLRRARIASGSSLRSTIRWPSTRRSRSPTRGLQDPQ